jgi:lysyl-tRNA synthetase class 1
MRRRLKVFDIIEESKTSGRSEKPLEERRQAFYPFTVFCESCLKDRTDIVNYDEDTATISYSCADCLYEGNFSLNERVEGKLVWKVDWPMRWKYEGVVFEPGGEDHSAPGSSFTVGKRIVKEIYGSQPPDYIEYKFVGMSGQSRISSSAGTVATPDKILEILEPAIVRWLYIRRNPNQAFTIDFGKEILRLYDEWDNLSKNVQKGKAKALNKFIGLLTICLKMSRHRSAAPLQVGSMLG